MRLLLSSVLLAASTAVSGVALAAPAVPALDHGDRSIVEKVHGCHRSTELGPAGWHYHVGPNCRRVASGPPRPYYDDRPRYRSRTVCLPKCRYIGPFKECKTECRRVSGPVDRSEW